MPDNILKLDEVEKIAQKFVRERKKIDLDKQEIQIHRIERSSSDQLGQYYEAEGKVRNIPKGTFDAFAFNTKWPTTECVFNLRISAKGGEVVSYNFQDIQQFS